VLLDITEVFEVKRKAMRCLGAQEHMWAYYEDLAVRRGVQLERNAGPNLGLLRNSRAEAFVRHYPHVTSRLS
jgi:4-oxalomesaconate hydratase